MRTGGPQIKENSLLVQEFISVTSTALDPVPLRSLDPLTTSPRGGPVLNPSGEPPSFHVEPWTFYSPEISLTPPPFQKDVTVQSLPDHPCLAPHTLHTASPTSTDPSGRTDTTPTQTSVDLRTDRYHPYSDLRGPPDGPIPPLLRPLRQVLRPNLRWDFRPLTDSRNVESSLYWKRKTFLLGPPTTSSNVSPSLRSLLHLAPSPTPRHPDSVSVRGILYRPFLTPSEPLTSLNPCPSARP